jgi:hypothetical protein
MIDVGITIFLPHVKVDFNWSRDFDDSDDDRIKVFVIEVDRDRGDVVIGRKASYSLGKNATAAVQVELSTNRRTVTVNINHFFVALAQAHQSSLTRIQRWPSIQEAVTQYRRRLSEPVVDLQRAVLAEANVIGATCSGIAGAKDFDCDFDCVIVDEAGRATPLDLLMAIVRGKSIVLVGIINSFPPSSANRSRKNSLTTTRRN